MDKEGDIIYISRSDNYFGIGSALEGNFTISALPIGYDGVYFNKDSSQTGIDAYKYYIPVDRFINLSEIQRNREEKINKVLKNGNV